MAIKNICVLLFLLFGCTQLSAQQAPPETATRDQAKTIMTKPIHSRTQDRERRINEFRERMAVPQDTLRIKSEGAGNRVVLDSTWYSDSGITKIIIGPFGGEISQEGENNEVMVNTGGHKQKVIVSQSGNNNRVKINSGN
jgi:hypothetical protein